MWNSSKYSNFAKDLVISENYKNHQEKLKSIKSSSKTMLDNNEPKKPRFLDFPLKLREYNISTICLLWYS